MSCSGRLKSAILWFNFSPLHLTLRQFLQKNITKSTQTPLLYSTFLPIFMELQLSASGLDTLSSVHLSFMFFCQSMFRCEITIHTLAIKLQTLRSDWSYKCSLVQALLLTFLSFSSAARSRDVFVDKAQRVLYVHLSQLKSDVDGWSLLVPVCCWLSFRMLLELCSGVYWISIQLHSQGRQFVSCREHSWSHFLCSFIYLQFALTTVKRNWPFSTGHHLKCDWHL